MYFHASYAIGGLSGGEDKNSFWRVVAQCTAALPEDKPRYVMVRMTSIISRSLDLYTLWAILSFPYVKTQATMSVFCE